jgi:hypothetical protein
MFNFAPRALLLILCVLVLPPAIQANDLYVSTNGTPAGPGTMAQPYDIATALSGQVGQPGDTFWLRGGNYTMGHIDTKIQGVPGQPITFRQMPGERARIDGSLTFFESAGNVVLRDLELYSSDTNRFSAQLVMDFNPTDIKIIPGIASYVPDMSFINMIVHDETRHGFYVSEFSNRNLIYGCLVYNNGWFSTNNAEGHNFYVQSERGTRLVADNIAFNPSGANFQIYENATNLHLVGVTLDGNVAFNAGAIQAVRTYRDWIVGVDKPALSADLIVLKNNMGYYPPGSAAFNQVQIGRQQTNGSVALVNNYFPQGLAMNNWTIAAVAGNLFMGQNTNYVVTLDQTQVPLATSWNDNTYLRSPVGGDFLLNSNEYGFTDWQGATGYDQHSAYNTASLSGTKVFVRPNQYEAGRANIIVYNWDNLSQVSVDVSSVMATNTPFEVRNAQDFFAPPVLSGVFNGQPLNLPMTGLTVAVPNGPMLTPPPTGPAFNVFILLPSLVRMQAAVVNGQTRVSWPANSGKWVLQSTASLSPRSAWTDDASAPVLAGGQYVVTISSSQGARFYRLRAAQ